MTTIWDQVKDNDRLPKKGHCYDFEGVGHNEGLDKMIAFLKTVHNDPEKVQKIIHDKKLAFQEDIATAICKSNIVSDIKCNDVVKDLREMRKNGNDL